MKKRKSKIKLPQAVWPTESVMAEIRDRLSADTVEGSRVIGPDSPLVDRIKQNLCSKIVEYKIRNKLTQKQLAKLLDVDEPEMSRILHYKIQRYTIDRLVGYVELLYPNMKFRLLAA